MILGKAVKVSYPISGVGTSDNPKLVIEDRFGNPLPNEINFDTLTRCKDSIFAFTIFEQGCDSLFLSVEWLDSTKTKAPPKSQFEWNTPASKWLINGDTVISGIEALTTIVGSYEGYLRITDSIKGGKSTLISLIPYKVFVEPGTRILALPDSSAGFDTITFCDQKDATVPIVNLGCDTIHDSSISINGIDFAIVNAPKTPFIINPSNTFFLDIRYLPVNTGESFDTLTIVTDADSAPVRQIPLSGFATPTDTIRFSVSTSNVSVVPGDTATLTIMPSSEFKNKGLNSMAIVLSYNGDIMSPYQTKNATTGMSGALAPSVGSELPVGPTLRNLPITINGANMTFDSTTPIVNIKFLISLSDSTSTDFHIASFVLNNGDNNFNKCLLGATADTGTIALRFVCGDTDLYNLLRYGANWSLTDGIVPSIGAPNPDPVFAGSVINIPFTALRPVSLKIEIMDETGRIVYSNAAKVPQAGASTFSIRDLPLGGGAYHYRLYSVDGGTAVVTGSFVVIR